MKCHVTNPLYYIWVWDISFDKCVIEFVESDSSPEAGLRHCLLTHDGIMRSYSPGFLESGNRFDWDLSDIESKVLCGGRSKASRRPTLYGKVKTWNCISLSWAPWVTVWGLLRESATLRILHLGEEGCLETVCHSYLEQNLQLVLGHY